MSSERMRRVDEAMRQVLSDAMTQDVKDPRVGFITVTDVKTSPDLRHARVYVSVLGDDAEREDSMEGLRSAHGFLQARVGRELHLKHTPTLQFLYDDTAERAARVEHLIRHPQAGDEPPGGA
jgi:ribosome-binding factor A